MEADQAEPAIDMEMLAEPRLPVLLDELEGSLGKAGKHLLDGTIAHRRELVPSVLESPHTVLDPEHGYAPIVWAHPAARRPGPTETQT